MLSNFFKTLLQLARIKQMSIPIFFSLACKQQDSTQKPSIVVSDDSQADYIVNNFQSTGVIMRGRGVGMPQLPC